MPAKKTATPKAAPRAKPKAKPAARARKAVAPVADEPIGLLHVDEIAAMPPLVAQTIQHLVAPRPTPGLPETESFESVVAEPWYPQVYAPVAVRECERCGCMVQGEPPKRTFLDKVLFWLGLRN